MTRDLWALIYALGKSYKSKYAVVIEPFLACTELPNLVDRALWALCVDLNLAPRYRDVVLSNLKRQDWDLLGNVQSVSMTIASQYLVDHSDPALLQGLLDSYDDERGHLQLRGQAFAAATWALGFKRPRHAGPNHPYDIVRLTPEERVWLEQARARLADELAESSST